MIDTTIINLQRQNIGATLKQARLNAGLTYYALAKQAGLKLHQYKASRLAQRHIPLIATYA